MVEWNRRHITVMRVPRVDAYTPASSARESKAPPSPSDRIKHGRDLLAQLDAAVKEASTGRDNQDTFQVKGALKGIYVQFQSHPGFELALTSLEPQMGKYHPELRAVTTRDLKGGGEPVQLATVFVPEGSIGTFTKRFEEYINEDTDKGNPKNKNLVERIAELRLATLRALWTDNEAKFPDGSAPVWWELWLRRREGLYSRLISFAENFDAMIGVQQLVFEDRLVVLVWATSAQLGAALYLLDDIAELRHPVDPVQFLADLAAFEQSEFVNELAERLVAPIADHVVTCLLDTGIATQHPLLQVAIDPKDAHTVDLYGAATIAEDMAPRWPVLSFTEISPNTS